MIKKIIKFICWPFRKFYNWLKMSKCEECQHDCHCKEELHSDVYGLCACEKCNCKSKAEDKSYENEGSLVIDETGECEGCQ